MGPFFHHLFSVCTFIIYCVYINVKHKLHGGEKNFLLGAELRPMPPAHGLKGAISNPILNRRKIVPVNQSNFGLAARVLPCCSRSLGVNTNTLSGFARRPLWVLSDRQDTPQGRITNVRVRGCNYTAHPPPRCAAQDGVSVAGLFCSRSR